MMSTHDDIDDAAHDDIDDAAHDDVDDVDIDRHHDITSVSPFMSDLQES